MPYTVADPVAAEPHQAVPAFPDHPVLLTDAEWQALLLPLMPQACDTLPGETS